ncbi:MAG: methyltransferase domain-containing protein [Zoogloeaceae bacterium]|nr:methyltransferase domain-containing protein [Zoogloeaceae bacterium]
MTRPDFTLDLGLVRRRAERAARGASIPDPLAREVARRMGERLEYIRLSPKRVLDVGCGAQADRPVLRAHYPQASYLGIDFASSTLPPGQAAGGFLQRLFGVGRGPGGLPVCADARFLPLARNSVSLVWSNLMLNWLHDPMPALLEMHRVLEVGGLLMFSTLGPDTLKELRGTLPGHRGDRVHRFIDMHDLGDALVKAGFSDPVMDMEMITLTYGDLNGLLADLRGAGATNAATTRPRGLAGKTEWAKARADYPRQPEDGRLPASFEVIQGHAWKMAPTVTADGRSVIRFDPKVRRP